MLTFRVLGAFGAAIEGRRVNLGGSKSRRILASLLLRVNRTVSVSQLVDAAWPENPPDTAEHQVRKAVSELRHRIPTGVNMLRTEDAGYRAVLAEQQLDLLVFHRHLAEARAARAANDPRAEAERLDAALGLWRGPILDGMHIGAVDGVCATVARQRLCAQERLLELRLEAADPGDVIEELVALAAEHPLRERLHSLLMAALVGAGRQAEAIEVYNDLRRALARELGIDPGAEVTRRYREILQSERDVSDAGAAPEEYPRRPPSSLPYDLPDFTGRTQDLAELRALVRAGPDTSLTIVTIDGMGGVGKTTLAVRAAHEMAERYPDGQLFVDLCGFLPGRRSVSPTVALNSLLRAVGVPAEQIPDDLAGCTTLWRVCTAARRLLLVLDNVASAAQVRPLLPSGNGSLVLITSRSQLVGLDGAAALPLGLPSAEDGLELLAKILGPTRVAAEQQWAAELVASCGRLPLAVRIAATRLRSRPFWTIEHLARRLRDRRSMLAELVGDDRDVRSVLEVSIESMRPEHQRLYWRLTRHVGVDCDVYAAAAVAGQPLELAARLLEDLLDARLLMQRAPGRYAFHDLLRNLAYAKPTESEGAVVRRRYLDYYLQAARRAAGCLRPGMSQPDLDPAVSSLELPPMSSVFDALAWFDAEQANLFAALEMANQSGDHQYVARLPLIMAPYLRTRGHLHEELTALQMAVGAACLLGQARLQSLALTALASSYWYLGRNSDGLDRAQQALTLASQVGDPAVESRCMAGLGMLYKNLGQYQEAVNWLERARDVCDRAGLVGDLATILASLGTAQATLQRYEESLGNTGSAVRLSREAGDLYGEMVSLISRARCHAALDAFHDALESLDDAAAVARRLGTPHGEASVHALYADVLRRMGRYDAAYRHGQLAMDILRKFASPGKIARLHNILGAVHQGRSEQDLAFQQYARAQEAAHQANLRLEEAQAQEGMAQIRHADGDVEATQRHWNLAVQHYREMGLPVPRRPWAEVFAGQATN